MKCVEIGSGKLAVIGHDIAKSSIEEHIKNFDLPPRDAILTDREVSGYYLKDIIEYLRPHVSNPAIIITDGNTMAKTIDAIKPIIERLLDIEFGPSDLLIVLGGGGLIDVARFVTGIFNCPMHTLIVPTTLLAMVEASQNNKAFLSFQSYKDLLQIDTHPSDVIIDTAFLRTVSARITNNGAAQIVFYGLIDDRDLLTRLSVPGDIAGLIEAAIRSGMKIRTNKPNSLLYGREIANAIETHFRFLKYTSGESMALALMAMNHSTKLEALYHRVGLPTRVEGVTRETLIKRILSRLVYEGDSTSIIMKDEHGSIAPVRMSKIEAQAYFENILAVILQT